VLLLPLLPMDTLWLTCARRAGHQWERECLVVLLCACLGISLVLSAGAGVVSVTASSVLPKVVDVLGQLLTVPSHGASPCCHVAALPSVAPPKAALPCAALPCAALRCAALLVFVVPLCVSMCMYICMCMCMCACT
jgi:hypothetical protein